MATYVDLGEVKAGCAKIDKAIDMFTNVNNSLTNAMELLDCNNLKFGDINSSLEEQLDILSLQVTKCVEMNDGVTATIRAAAEEQYREYLESLKKEKNNTTEK